MAAITYNNVRKQYADGTVAVTDLNLEIADGEFLIMVGPSGCGKTTALRMAAGLEEISGGELRVGEKVVNDLAPRDRDIAMVFQNYALYPHMSIFDNIAFPLESQGMSRPDIKARVEEVAEVLDLTPHLRRRPKNLSGGQRQRVAMGRAIVRRPRAFLMDEPLSNLDAKLRVQMRAEITRMQRSLGTTTFYVTHDQIEAMTMGDRIAVMNKGLLQQVGTPMELYDRPANMFVAAFVGSPSMNLLTIKLEREAPGFVGHIGAQRISVGTHAELERYAGKTIVLGIRPEDWVPASLAPGAPTIRAERSMVEMLPPEQLVHLDLDTQVEAITTEVDEGAEKPLHSQERGARIIARIASSFEVGGGRSEWGLRRLYLFDPETGAAVLRT